MKIVPVTIDRLSITSTELQQFEDFTGSLIKFCNAQDGCDGCLFEYFCTEYCGHELSEELAEFHDTIIDKVYITE